MELIEELIRNRDGVVEASKAFLRGSMERQAYLEALESFRRRQSETVSRLLEAARRMNPVERARMLMRVAVDSRLVAIAQAVRTRLDGEWGRWAALVLEEKFSAASRMPAPQVAAPRPSEAGPEAPRRDQAPEPAAAEGGPEAAPRPREAPKGEPREPAPQPAIRLDREGVKAAVARALGGLAERGPGAVHRELDELLGLVDLSPLERQLIYLARLMLYYLMGELGLETARELGEEYGSMVRELSERGQPVRERVAAVVAEASRLASVREEVKDLANLALLATRAAPQGEGARAWSPYSSSQ